MALNTLKLVSISRLSFVTLACFQTAYIASARVQEFEDTVGGSSSHHIQSAPVLRKDETEEQNIMRLSAPFITAETTAGNRRLVKDALLLLPMGARENLVAQVLSLTPEEKKVYFKLPHALWMLASCSSEEARTTLASLVRSFQCREGQSQQTLLEKLYDTPEEDREALVKSARTLFTDDMSSNEQLGVLTSMKRIKKEERVAFIDLARKAFANKDFSGYQRAVFIDTLSSLPADEWQDVLDFCQTICPPTPTNSEIIDSLVTVQNVATEKRSIVIPPALKIFEASMPSQTRREIIYFLTWTNSPIPL